MQSAATLSFIKDCSERKKEKRHYFRRRIGGGRRKYGRVRKSVCADERIMFKNFIKKLIKIEPEISSCNKKIGNWVMIR